MIKTFPNVSYLPVPVNNQGDGGYDQNKEVQSPYKYNTQTDNDNNKKR